MFEANLAKIALAVGRTCLFGKSVRSQSMEHGTMNHHLPKKAQAALVPLPGISDYQLKPSSLC